MGNQQCDLKNHGIAGEKASCKITVSNNKLDEWNKLTGVYYVRQKGAFSTFYLCRNCFENHTKHFNLLPIYVAIEEL